MEEKTIEKETKVLDVIDEKSTAATMEATPVKKARPKKGESPTELKRTIKQLELALQYSRDNAQSAFEKANGIERDLNDLRLQYAKLMNFVSAQVNAAASAVNLALKGDL